MRESRGWLKFIICTNLLRDVQAQPLVDEAGELLRMLAKSALTARGPKTE
jgi:hypothetical protein